MLTVIDRLHITCTYINLLFKRKINLHNSPLRGVCKKFHPRPYLTIQPKPYLKSFLFIMKDVICSRGSIVHCIRVHQLDLR